jgi:phosphoenolpyruvate carboxylase
MDDIELITDQADAHRIRTARNDAAYALIMAERTELTAEELRSLIRKLADTVQDVASVAERRRERANEPAYGPAARALEQALRESLSRF